MIIFNFIIAILGRAIYTAASGNDYYQLISSLSFNEKDLNSINNIKQSYVLSHDSIMTNKTNLILLPWVPIGNGLISSKSTISSSNIEFQFILKYPSYTLNSNLIYFYFYNAISNNLSAIIFDTVKNMKTIIYYKEFHTQPKYLKIEDLLYDNNKHKGVEDRETCYEFVGGRNVKVTVRVQNGKVSLFWDSNTNWFISCFSNAKSKNGNGTEPPVTYGLGMVNNEKLGYFGSVEVKKISVFNRDYLNKDSFNNKDTSKVTPTENSNNTIPDLIAEYSKLKKKSSSETLKDIEELAYVIKKSLDESNNIGDNTENIKKSFDNLYDYYTNSTGWIDKWEKQYFNYNDNSLESNVKANDNNIWNMKNEKKKLMWRGIHSKITRTITNFVENKARNSVDWVQDWWEKSKFWEKEIQKRYQTEGVDVAIEKIMHNYRIKWVLILGYLFVNVGLVLIYVKIK